MWNNFYYKTWNCRHFSLPLFLSYAIVYLAKFRHTARTPNLASFPMTPAHNALNCGEARILVNNAPADCNAELSKILTPYTQMVTKFGPRLCELAPMSRER